MKRVILGVAICVTASALALPGIPDGTFAGKGHMRTAAGLDREYTAKLSLHGETIEASYDYGGGNVVRYEATMQATSTMEFDVLEAGRKAGSGYCENGLCHLDMPGHQAEETWFFRDGTLTRVGSMQHGNQKLIYTEQLASTARGTGQLVLECEGFEYSDTVKVQVYRDDTVGSLVEVKKDGKQDKRLLTSTELAPGEYKISPIYDIERVIKRKNDHWVVAYGCGEERPISCKDWK